MGRQKRYRTSDKMSDLVTGNYRVLLAMSRFGIGLGFGDKTIGEVCAENGVDAGTFLAVADMMLGGGDAEGYTVSPESLVMYLHNSHDYFLDFRLPKIRRDLVGILGHPQDDLTKAVVDYFDEYAAEVCRHMMYEEETVFPYVRSLLKGERNARYSIAVFQKHHDQVEERLREFKNILIKYYPSKSTNELNSLLFDIFNCEYDLRSHNEIEDRLFVPVILGLEQKTPARK